MGSANCVCGGLCWCVVNLPVFGVVWWFAFVCGGVGLLCFLGMLCVVCDCLVCVMRGACCVTGGRSV